MFFFKVFTKKGSKWAATPRWTEAILELSDESDWSDRIDQSGAVVIAPDRYYGSSSSQTPSKKKKKHIYIYIYTYTYTYTYTYI